MVLFCPLWSLTLFYALKMQFEPRANYFSPRTQQEITHCVINSIPPTHTHTQARVQMFQMSNTSFTYAFISLISALRVCATNGAVHPTKQLFTHTHTLLQKFAAIWSFWLFCFRKELQAHTCCTQNSRTSVVHVFYVIFTQ